MAEQFHKPTRCALCSDEAVAIYYLPRGCVAYADLTVQPLCLHHEDRATPLGGMELLKDLRVGPPAPRGDDAALDRARAAKYVYRPKVACENPPRPKPPACDAVGECIMAGVPPPRGDERMVGYYEATIRAVLGERAVDPGRSDVRAAVIVLDRRVPNGNGSAVIRRDDGSPAQLSLLLVLRDGEGNPLAEGSPTDRLKAHWSSGLAGKALVGLTAHIYSERYPPELWGPPAALGDERTVTGVELHDGNHDTGQYRYQVTFDREVPNAWGYLVYDCEAGECRLPLQASIRDGDLGSPVTSLLLPFAGDRKRFIDPLVGRTVRLRLDGFCLDASEIWRPPGGEG